MKKLLYYFLLLYLLAYSISLKSLRIMTFNIHFGNTINNEFDILKISKVIKGSQCDIVCLQEVDNNWSSRSDYQSLVSIISKKADLPYYIFNPIYNKASSRGPKYPNEQFGTAILSKYKILESHDYIISRWSTQKGDPQPGEKGFPSQLHGFGNVIIDINGANISVYNTHLDYRADPPEGYKETLRAIQVREMLNIINYKYPTILTGDMNADLSAKDVFEPLLKYFDDAWSIAGKGMGLSFPCNEPYTRIDYILVNKNSNIRVKNAYIIQEEASDHLPVVAEIDF
jgi:endonuclease/exonuclease/phosphatase family metal-dependent hydrolase